MRSFQPCLLLRAIGLLLIWPLVACTQTDPSPSAHGDAQAPGTTSPGITPSSTAPTAPQIPIFGFHNIVDLEGDDANNPIVQKSRESYSKQNMAAFLEYLAVHNYWLLSTQELYDYFLSDTPVAIPEAYRDRKPVVITFDDGYTGTHTHLLTILKAIETKYQKKLKVVLFVNPGVFGVPGVEFDHATCAELTVGLQAGYYDLQSHGLTHKNLTELTPAELKTELAESQARLRDCTQAVDPQGNVATHIAYPFGATNAQVEAQVAQYYRSAFLYNTKVLNPASLPTPYQVPRLPVNKTMSVDRLKQMAAGQ